jgi:hypothetical protein
MALRRVTFLGFFNTPKFLRNLAVGSRKTSIGGLSARTVHARLEPNLEHGAFGCRTFRIRLYRDRRRDFEVAAPNSGRESLPSDQMFLTFWPDLGKVARRFHERVADLASASIDHESDSQTC